jgi:hypothetical protein
MARHDSQLARSESVSISARLGGRTSENLVVAFLWRRVVTVRFAYQSFQKSQKRSLARARHVEPCAGYSCARDNRVDLWPTKSPADRSQRGQVGRKRPMGSYRHRSLGDPVRVNDIGRTQCEAAHTS